MCLIVILYVYCYHFAMGYSTVIRFIVKYMFVFVNFSGTDPESDRSVYPLHLVVSFPTDSRPVHSQVTLVVSCMGSLSLSKP